jgi:hypothetical protein
MIRTSTCELRFIQNCFMEDERKVNETKKLIFTRFVSLDANFFFSLSRFLILTCPILNYEGIQLEDQKMRERHKAQKKGL